MSEHEKHRWIKGAIKHPGALRKTAKGMGLLKGGEKLTLEDIEKLIAKGGVTGKRAQLAKTLRKMHD